jgi:polyferredoxin
MECVGCTACIDACDNIMDKIGKPKGLIRYASENSIESGESLKYTARMKMYTLLLFVVVSILSFLLLTRKDVDVTIMRTPGIMYQEIGTDSISNLYNLKAVNKTLQDVRLTIKLENGTGRIQTIGFSYINVVKEGQGSGSFFVVLPKTVIKERSTHIVLGLYQGDKKIATAKTNFLGPIVVSE